MNAAMRTGDASKFVLRVYTPRHSIAAEICHLAHPARTLLSRGGGQNQKEMPASLLIISHGFNLVDSLVQRRKGGSATHSHRRLLLFLQHLTRCQKKSLCLTTFSTKQPYNAKHLYRLLDPPPLFAPAPAPWQPLPPAVT